MRKKDPPLRTELWWPNRRSTVAHIYVKGPGSGDGSFCGQPLGSDARPSMMENDPVCRRCVVARGR